MLYLKLALAQNYKPPIITALAKLMTQAITSEQQSFQLVRVSGKGVYG
jgi:hypothetical protein